MNLLDWSIVAVYMFGMIFLSAWLSRRQRTGRDYYLGGNKMSWWAIGISVMATQCSTNSLLGAPAFVIAVGGMLWMQYELAVPLAMIALMFFLTPFFQKHNAISVYEYLEHRFGPGSRTLLSILFQFLRAFSTGVTVYGLAIVIEQLTALPFWAAVLLIGAVTVIYDFLGGMKAVVYSDVIQMLLLYTGIALCLVLAMHLVGGWNEMWRIFPAEKAATLSFKGFGLQGNQTFTFWPMLIGGFFLYLSYYGCDQTQAQRLLSTKNAGETNLVLLLNGLLRFPLVLTYCLVGVAVGAYMTLHPELLAELPLEGGKPNYNLAVPIFCLRMLPHGIIGLIMVALFAAAMSSLDSTINSLSAATMRDVVQRFWKPSSGNPKAEFFLPRLITVFWGALCLVFSFYVGNMSASIIETINKISSLANGPILATFLLAVLTRRANDKGVIFGILAGFAANAALWLGLPQISWLWWNLSGCVVTFGCGYLASLALPAPVRPHSPAACADATGAGNRYRHQAIKYSLILAGYFVLMLLVLFFLQQASK